MKPVNYVGALIVGLLLLFIVRFLYLVTPVATKLQTTPWWIYIVVGGIVLSGFLSFKYAREDREVEQRWIEQEGEVFMEPIRKRRSDKQMMN